MTSILCEELYFVGIYYNNSVSEVYDRIMKQGAYVAKGCKVACKERVLLHWLMGAVIVRCAAAGMRM